MAATDANLPEKLQRYQQALTLFTDRLSEDPWILAAVLIGTLDETTIWKKDGLSVWLIEADGVSRRMKYDGNDEGMSRIFCENGVTLYVDVFPRTRFRRMVEGSSRTAFRHSYHAARTLIYSSDASIDRWFRDANTPAPRDQDRERMVAACWAIEALRSSERMLLVRDDHLLAEQHLMWLAHSLASIEVIGEGKVWEQEFIYRAKELNPTLFSACYDQLLKGARSKRKCLTAAKAGRDYLQRNTEAFMKPVLLWLRKQKRPVPLSELADHFAYSQLYPWHLETACDWLDEQGLLMRTSAPFSLTKKSRTELEEPAYHAE